MKLFQRPDFPLPPNKNPALLPGAKFDPRQTGIDDPRRSLVGGAPIALSSQIVISSTANSMSLPFDSQTLQPAMRTAYWVDEIRLGIHTALPSALDAVYPHLGAALQLQFWTGAYKFSKAPVPASLYAPAWSLNESYGIGGNHAGLSSLMRWCLPKPLFLLPGDVIGAHASVPNWYGFTLVGGATVVVTLTYIGRIAVQGAVLPKTRCVPWVSYFQKAGSTAYAATTDEFRNPFLDDLHVQRFTSRTTRTKVTIRGVTTTELVESVNPYIFPNALTPTNAYVDMRMYDSEGFAVVGDYTPIGDVIEPSRKAWTFGRPLGPREQFDMQLRTNNVAAINPDQEDFLTQVGMVGYREENV